MRSTVLLALACALAGCVAPGTREAVRYHVLEIPTPPAETRAPAAGTLLVATGAAPFYDTSRIVFSRTPGTRAYYQFNRWTERPERAIRAALIERLERRGTFARVDDPARGAAGDWLLNVRIEEMYHDAGEPPGRVHVALAASLAETSSRKTLAARTFSITVASPSHDARGAVRGFNRAVALALDELMVWLDDVAPR